MVTAINRINVGDRVAVRQKNVLPSYDIWSHPCIDWVGLYLDTYSGGDTEHLFKGKVTHIKTHKWFGLVELPYPLYTIRTDEGVVCETYKPKVLLKNKPS